MMHISRVSCQKGPTRHANAWQIGPFWQDTLGTYHIAFMGSHCILEVTLYLNPWWAELFWGDINMWLLLFSFLDIEIVQVGLDIKDSLLIQYIWSFKEYAYVDILCCLSGGTSGNSEAQI